MLRDPSPAAIAAFQARMAASIAKAKALEAMPPPAAATPTIVAPIYLGGLAVAGGLVGLGLGRLLQRFFRRRRPVIKEITPEILVQATTKPTYNAADVTAALQALGYNKLTAMQLLATVPLTYTTQQAIKHCLHHHGKS